MKTRFTLVNVGKQFAAAALAVAAFTSGTSLAQTPIKIGFMAELSGPQGPLGQDQYDAFMMLVEQNGGKLGGAAVQVFREDSQLKPDVAVQIADKLIEREKVSIITGITFSNVMMAVHKRITDKGVFLIGSNAGPSPIAGAACSPYYFTTSWENGQQAEVMGKYSRDQKFGRIVSIAPNYQAGRDFVNGFRRWYTTPLATELWPAVNQLDFSAEIAQIAAAQPEAVFAFLPGGMGVNFIKQWAQSGLNKKIQLLTTSTTDGIGLPAMGDAALGVISGTFWGPDFKNAANQKFVKDFEAKYKRIPSQYAAQAYDSAQLLDSAIRKVKGDVGNKEALRSALKQADFKSVRGEFKFGTNQFPVQDFHVFKAVRDKANRMTLETIGTPLLKVVDSHADKCPLK
jgi:branched-chain amino acid transport system substrate-binding protein